MIKELKSENQKKWNQNEFQKNIEMPSDDECDDSELEELQQLKNYKTKRKKKDFSKFTQPDNEMKSKIKGNGEGDENRKKARRNERASHNYEEIPKHKKKLNSQKRL